MLTPISYGRETSGALRRYLILPGIPAHRMVPECVSTKADLSWSPGVKATMHDVYFGTNFNDVSTASRLSPKGVLKSKGQSGTTYDPGTMAFDTTYYWRIDEVNTYSPYYLERQCMEFQDGILYTDYQTPILSAGGSLMMLRLWNECY